MKKTGPKPKPLAERFWSRVNKNGPVPTHMPHLGQCWVWTGYVSKLNGYGRMGIGSLSDGTRKNIHTHRVAFFLHHGRWPEPNALHHCDNRACCRPAHLFEGDNGDNVRDMFSKGRENLSDRKGECNGRHRLTEDDVRSIRKLRRTGVPQTIVARQFGIHPNTVNKIYTRVLWRHV